MMDCMIDWFWRWLASWTKMLVYIMLEYDYDIYVSCNPILCPKLLTPRLNRTDAAGHRSKPFYRVVVQYISAEGEVRRKPNIKRDHRFKLPVLLGRQPDTKRRHIGQQMLNLRYPTRKDIRRFMWRYARHCIAVS